MDSLKCAYKNGVYKMEIYIYFRYLPRKDDIKT